MQLPYFLLPTSLLTSITYLLTAAASRSTAEATASEEKAYLGVRVACGLGLGLGSEKAYLGLG